MGKPTTPRVREQLSPWIVGRPNDDGEVRGFCPLCEEPGESTTPSASFNFEEGVFTCFSQCGGMSVHTLVHMLKQDGDLARAAETNGHVRRADKVTTKTLPAPSPQPPGRALPTTRRLKEFTDRLLRNAEKLGYLRDKRGLTKKTIQQFGLGWDGHRYTIPVYDAEGALVNVRRYDPWAKEAKDKMMSWSRGHGSRRIYGLDALEEFETIVLVEGEMDKLIGRQYTLPTITHTGGATSWDSAWNELFTGKKVFICYDCDDSGRRGARKVQGQLKHFAREVHIIALPLSGKGDDLTNFFVDHDRTVTEFYALMKEATEQAYRSEALQRQRSADPVTVSLEQTMNPLYVDKPITFTATIAGKTMPPHHVPRRLEFACNEGGGTRCSKCPISGRNHLEIDVPRNDPIALEIIGAAEDRRRRVLLKYAGLPPTCPDVEKDEVGVYTVEELVLLPPADEQVGSINKVDRKIFNVGEYASPVNAKAEFVGLNTTSPADGRAALLAWESRLATSDIDTFVMTPEQYHELQAFWPAEGQTPLQKMREITDDLEANVTKIYGRPALHMAYDLVWHSVQDFTFKGVDAGKGWIEILVIGDTRTGKSEAAKRLCHHYRAGVLTTCEGATFAGLVGGVQKISDVWMVQWGVIPLNDRRLVVLDEAGALADKGIVEQMSSVRSSGIAQINKIQMRETHARTRLIWIANPTEGVTVESYSNGAIDAVKGLAKNPEDVARFDFALAVASSDVKATDINTRRPPRVRHRYTQKLCGTLVNWVWSRQRDHIVWESGVENYVLDVAQELGRRYIPEPPLIQVENARIKLARLAVAVAGRLFSTDDSGELLIVGREHVRAAEKLLDGFYGMPAFGYAAHSALVLRERSEAAQNTARVRRYLTANEDVLETLRSCMSGPFRMRDFQEFGSMSQIEAQDAVRVLQQQRMVRRLTKGYIRAEPTLIEIVRSMERAQ
jgi:hypothetical protein